MQRNGFQKSYCRKTEATGFNFSLKVWERPPNGLHYCQAARAEAIKDFCKYGDG